jgi:integrase
MVEKREFTDRFLQSIEPAEAGKRFVIYDANVPGFGIRVNERSSKENKGAFVLISRFPGSKNPVPRRIGNYPEMSIEEAREIARTWREHLRHGDDPKTGERFRGHEEGRNGQNTFAAAFVAFASDHLSQLRTGKAVRAALETHVLSRWGPRPISQIKRADVLELIAALRTDMPIGTNRVLAYLKTMFSWTIEQGMLDASPAASVKRPAREVKRDRVLDDAEIRAIWLACGELGVFGRAFRIMLTTAQRRSEVGSMTWAEIDRKHAVWRLSRERTKADRAHEVPLSRLALKIINEGHRVNDFVFSTNGASAKRKGAPISQSGPIRGWGKAKIRLDKLAREKAAQYASYAGEDALAPFGEWRLHDLRRTAATHMAKLGVDRVVIAKILNHTETEITAVYDRYDYDKEKRRALDLWANRLQTIVAGIPHGNVVQIGARS